MKAEVFEQEGWKELEPVRRSVTTERRVDSAVNQRSYLDAEWEPYKAEQIAQVRGELGKFTYMTPYSTDWLNQPRVVVRKQEAPPKSTWELVSEIFLEWLADFRNSKKEK
jgi:hypothetical protein